ncbi:CDP-alcohol phosphatidyltransferase family protein [Glycomyces tenuis]|uniref:CDP-alcohol phosphatidyltransferase family protein n=1 Tax=Glycomyces tenuis TaxID=58116 RepID=UPI000423773E|nr:CDP-alcohol phosphatidyltransferase family protein [Glycomyces tenuis]
MSGAEPRLWARSSWRTVPNLVTAARFALIVPITALLLTGAAPFAAALLAAVFGATDWVDGRLARRLGQVSRVGAVLDPLADRIGIGCIALALALVGAVPWWLVAVFPAVDLLLAGVFAARGRRPEVSRIGKIRTGVAAVAIVVAVLGTAPGLDAVSTAGRLGLACAALLHLLAGAGYLRRLLSE